MNTIDCPRCLGKKHVDKTDIERLNRQNEWLPGPCAYCDQKGFVDSNKPKDILVDKADVVYEVGVEELISTKNHSMENISIFSRIFRIVVILLILIVLSFVYTYLTALNPIVYFNVVIWYFFGAILIIPLSVLSINKSYRIFASILISCFTIYLVYGIKSSIFMETALSAVLKGDSMLLPKVNFGDLISTLTSLTEYNLKLDFLFEYDTLNLSYKGSKGVDTGSSFTNFFRIIECLGIFILPVYTSRRDKNT